LPAKILVLLLQFHATPFDRASHLLKLSSRTYIWINYCIIKMPFTARNTSFKK
jgi:hypothetical protein